MRSTRTLPDEAICGPHGYAINIPAEWQMPSTEWWTLPGAAEQVMNERAAAGIVLRDALWAHAAGEDAPDPDSYRFDPATQRYLTR